MAAALLIAGCSPKSDTPSASSRQERDLDARTAAENPRLYPGPRKIPQDRSIPLAWWISTMTRPPACWPLSRARCRGCLFLPVDTVKKGDPLAAVDSPDFAAAVSAYRKALVTAQNSRKLANLDKDLLSHQGISQREAEQAQTDAAGAEADSDAALQSLVSRCRSAVIADTQEGKADGPGRRVDPLADRRNGGGKADHAGTTSAGGHHALFYRRRSFACLGDCAYL